MNNPAPLFALTRPAYVDHVHLVVSDLAQVSSFYQRVIGLSVIEKSKSGETLGVDTHPLLTLTTANNVSRAPRQAAGLFHTAFLVPGRSDLAHWLAHAANNNIGLDGASDHLVSEALYLSDPEANGIEIYWDRSQDKWTYEEDGSVEMATLRLDLQELYASAPKTPFVGMANGTAVGHIHLQVGNVPEAEAFYRDVVGLNVMAHYPGASFFGFGDYHHHVAANVWNSRGASARADNMTGLSGYALRFNDRHALDKAVASLSAQGISNQKTADGWSLTDPWGIGITLSA